MINRYLRKKEEVEINITPMLDVVFIILIFFIVTTSLTKETGLAIFKSNNTITKIIKVRNAIIKLDAQNNHSVNGVASTLDGIESLLANLKAANPEVQVQILTSKDVLIGDLVQVIHQLKTNDIIKYSVSSY